MQFAGVNAQRLQAALLFWWKDALCSLHLAAIYAYQHISIVVLIIVIPMICAEARVGCGSREQG